MPCAGSAVADDAILLCNSDLRSTTLEADQWQADLLIVEGSKKRVKHVLLLTRCEGFGTKFVNDLLASRL